eukprot:CAMPEP_0206206494 /NCGR_PEP_ID=MMETSP0166-20121206/14972_1 /ASSEMBLY_ACC=CAM_ASM_000260 /TAXON_ID=95228 /ORGANISM="Vannella robusta, Strain DIVA3 518/3/11/1/6" /LENGTH=75 /DNA_ID=CAMNT_0053626961 /DNA_START=349 /DNA_END=573 /DNA_ORIENTATION=-
MEGSAEQFGHVDAIDYYQVAFPMEMLTNNISTSESSNILWNFQRGFYTQPAVYFTFVSIITGFAYFNNTTLLRIC